MTRKPGLISVVLGTTCEKRRAKSIRCAIATVLCQEGVEVELLLVVNGARFDPALLSELESEARIRVLRLEQASVSAARDLGWRESHGEYVSFLDDDDEFLPGCLKLRRDALDQDPSVDYVATNGYSDHRGPGQLWVQNVDEVKARPDIAAVREQWLPSCGGMFRVRSISNDFFTPVFDFHEWTWFNFQLLRAGKKVCFIDEPTFHVHQTPGSASRLSTKESVDADLFALRRMEAEATDDQLPILRRKVGLSLHSSSDFYRANGDVGLAWSLFFECLEYPGGWSHLFYVRHLLRTSITRLFGGRRG